jgi:hypothetical protein
LALFYDYSTPGFDWRKAKIPTFIGRINLDTETAKSMVDEIISIIGLNDTKTVVFIDDTHDNIMLIQKQYERFAAKYNCYIEWDIEDIVIEIVEEVDEEEASFLLVLYAKPLFSPVEQVDINKEPPLAIYHITGEIYEEMISQICSFLCDKGYPPEFGILHPYSEEIYEFFCKKNEQFVERTNACLNCLQNMNSELGKFSSVVCRSCKIEYIKGYALALLKQGITEIYADSDEVEIDEDFYE